MTKAKTCKQCSTPFVPFNTTDRVCSVKCAVAYVKQANEIKQAKAWRKEKLERKKAIETKPEAIKKTQTSYNAWVRYRDQDKPCPSCNRYDSEIPDTFRGGKWDCGHFLTVGAHYDLRFHPLNAAKQCKSCNGGSGRFTKKNHTVSQQFEESMIERIGHDNVDWLKGPHEAQNWTIEDIREIAQWYKEQLKYLVQERENRG